jgi:lysine decarboxylase
MNNTIYGDENSIITRVLNRKTSKAIRWCTPSIDLKMEKVKQPYDSDMSISYQTLGLPNIPSGMFKRAYKKAAKAYGADCTLFSVNGSTGSNFVVLRALSKQIPFLKVLAMRNIHKSVLHACEDYSINLMLLPPNIDEELQIFLPNTIEEILEGIEKAKPDVLLLTNPTYEGITLDLKTLVKTVRKRFPSLIIFVDEAWGAHLKFSERLPISAMESGVDICIQSTHKQGGSLQQTGMIHWHRDRINSELLIDSYQSISTTSPSYILLASLDAARVSMEKYGKQKIDQLLLRAEKLAKGIQTVPGFKVVDTLELHQRNPSVFDRDRTKVIIDVSKIGLSGLKISKILEEKYNIITERYDAKVLLFLTTLQLKDEDISRTINALRKIALMTKIRTREVKTPIVKIPKRIIKRREVSEVAKLRLDEIEKVPLEKAYGRISAEDIAIYPPGIPITIRGEEFTKEVINYYLAYREYSNLKIMARDREFKTVVVIKQP